MKNNRNTIFLTFIFSLFALPLFSQYSKDYIHAEELWQKGKEDKAIKVWTKSALEGDAQSAYRLGCVYRDTTTWHSIEASLRYYDIAARMHLDDANYALATIYLEGEDVTKDTLKAIDYLTQVPDLTPSWKRRLGFTCKQVGKYRQAIACLKTSEKDMEWEDVEAVAECYYQMREVSQSDFLEAIRWAQKVYQKKKDEASIRRLLSLYDEDVAGHHSDYLQLCEALADLGDPQMQINLIKKTDYTDLEHQLRWACQLPSETVVTIDTFLVKKSLDYVNKMDSIQYATYYQPKLVPLYRQLTGRAFMPFYFFMLCPKVHNVYNEPYDHFEANTDSIGLVTFSPLFPGQVSCVRPAQSDKYYSPDLRRNGLFGQVQKFVVTQSIGKPEDAYEQSFRSDGTEIFSSTSKVKRDSQSRVIEYHEDSETDYFEEYKYSLDGDLIQRRYGETDYIVDDIYERKNGLLMNSASSYSEDGGVPSYYGSLKQYKYISFDSHGNWTRRLVRELEISYIYSEAQGDDEYESKGSYSWDVKESEWEEEQQIKYYSYSELIGSWKPIEQKKTPITITFNSDKTLVFFYTKEKVEHLFDEYNEEELGEMKMNVEVTIKTTYSFPSADEIQIDFSNATTTCDIKPVFTGVPDYAIAYFRDKVFTPEKKKEIENSIVNDSNKKKGEPTSYSVNGDELILGGTEHYTRIK